MAILAGVVQAAAFHLDGDDVGGLVVVETARLGIEVQSVDLWRFRGHGRTPVLFSYYTALGRRRDMAQFDRITRNPSVMGGKPCVRGMRVTVGMIVGQIGAGHTIDELLADYPYLEREDILQALRYAAWLAEEREVTLPRA